MAQDAGRMDQFTSRQWEEIKASDGESRDRVADTVLDLLRSLDRVVEGFPVDQLTHACQTATRAERSGASPDMVLAALCHDLGKAISDDNHGAISAEILKPYVEADAYQIVKTHQDFQLRHYGHEFGGDVNARDRHRHKAWFSRAEMFADEWDQLSFDPLYDSRPLEHFEPLVRELFGQGTSRRLGNDARGTQVSR